MSLEFTDPGPEPKLEWIDLSTLIVDHSYQREAHQLHAQKILKAFRWAYFQAITVTPLENGKYAVIDGQHRIMAVRNHPSVERVPCVVVGPATVAEQAKGFVIMNEMHKRITPVEMYWAGLAAEDPEYLRIAHMLGRAGLDVHTQSGGATPPRTTLAINTIRKVYRRHGEQYLEAALGAMVKAWPTTPNSSGATIIEASELILRTNADIVADQLSVVLGGFRPIDLLNRARVQAAENDTRVYPAMVNIILDRIKGPRKRETA